MSTARQVSRTAKKAKKKKPKIVKLEALKQINLNAAGLDIGAAEIWVAVPEGRVPESVRVFETFTVDLHALADWLEACGVDTVAMESTGIYWIPVYQILEAQGVRALPGQCASYPERTGKEDRHPGLPMDSAIAHLWSASGFLYPRSRDARLCAPWCAIGRT